MIVNRLKYIIIFSTCLFCSVLCGQSYDELVNKKKSLKKESDQLNIILQKNQLNQKNTLESLSILNKKINIQQGVLLAIEQEIEFLLNQIDSLQKDLEFIQKKLIKLKTNYSLLIKKNYYASQKYNNILFFLSSQSFNQLIRRFFYFKKLEINRREKFKEIQNLKTHIQTKKKQIIVTKNLQLDLFVSKKSKISLLNRTQKDKEDLLFSLKNKEDSLCRVLSIKKDQANKISKEILSLLEKEKNKKTALTPELKLISSNFEQNKGRLPWPTHNGNIVSKFGETPHPVLSGISIVNNGVEIITNNNNVRSVFEGRIVKVIVLPNGLKGVIINHGDYFTVYSNLIEVYVLVNEKVTTKHTIGTLYNKENKQRNILEFQIWKTREKLNPEQWLSSY